MEPDLRGPVCTQSCTMLPLSKTYPTQNKPCNLFFIESGGRGDCKSALYVMKIRWLINDNYIIMHLSIKSPTIPLLG